MDRLGCAVVTTDDLDFSDARSFAETVSFFALSAYKEYGLIYYFKRGDHASNLPKNKLDENEGLILFAESSKKMTTLIDKWTSSRAGLTKRADSADYIASKRQIAIVCGSRSGEKSTAIGKFLKAQPGNIGDKAQTVKFNFAQWKTKFLHRGNAKEMRPMPNYSYAAAKAHSGQDNAINNFFYCYVGAPNFGPTGDLDITVLHDRAITLKGLIPKIAGK